MLGDHGITLRVLTAEAVDKGSLHLAPDDMRDLGVEIDVVDPDNRAAEGCELVLVLGGDGSFLRAAELARTADIPVLGSTSAGSGSWPRPRPTTSTGSSTTSSPATTGSRTG